MLIIEENFIIVIIFLIYLLNILLAYVITKKNYNNYAFYLLLIPFYNIWIVVKIIFISIEEKNSNHIYTDNTTSKTSLINKTVLLSTNNTFENITLYEGNSLIIGRESTMVDFIINSHYISKKHLRIWSQNSLIYVKAFSTTNGTYIDGKILESNISYPLKEGEKLIIGSEEAIYTIDRINNCEIF